MAQSLIEEDGSSEEFRGLVATVEKMQADSEAKAHAALQAANLQSSGSKNEEREVPLREGPLKELIKTRTERSREQILS